MNKSAILVLSILILTMFSFASVSAYSYYPSSYETISYTSKTSGTNKGFTISKTVESSRIVYDNNGGYYWDWSANPKTQVNSEARISDSLAREAFKTYQQELKMEQELKNRNYVIIPTRGSYYTSYYSGYYYRPNAVVYNWGF